MCASAQIIRLGKSGYKTTMLSTMRTANMLAKELLATGMCLWATLTAVRMLPKPAMLNDPLP